MNNSTYLHVLDGRIRVKVQRVKKSPNTACEVEHLLRGMSGITGVKANSLTGNVLILFDPGVIDQEQILETLRREGYVTGALNAVRQSGNIVLENDIANLLAQSAIEVGIKLLVSALI